MPSLVVAVLAHNEARRIGICLRSLLAEPGDFPIHVVVNGSTDNTAQISRGFGNRVAVHDYQQGGKTRSWTRFVFDELMEFAEIHIFVDGDAEIVAGSIAAIATAFAEHPRANAVAAQPRNGRSVRYYQSEQTQRSGIFGDLYALRGGFLARMKSAGIRLPDDLIGDDGLIGALAKTDLANEDQWCDQRVFVCQQAGFLCEPVSVLRPRSWKMQYRRMINYSVRHFQNQIVSAIMRGPGPAALPPRLSDQYRTWLPRFRPRPGLSTWWFDKRALARMQARATV